MQGACDWTPCTARPAPSPPASRRIIRGMDTDPVYGDEQIHDSSDDWQDEERRDD